MRVFMQDSNIILHKNGTHGVIHTHQSRLQLPVFHAVFLRGHPCNVAELARKM